MKIIAGLAKNRKIKSLQGTSTRPTLERIRKSLFDILNPYIPESSFLDLYSGTGSIALEALSRGAKRAIMIEKDPKMLKILIENINSLGFEYQCRAYKNNSERAIEILANKSEKFDIIFLDPPYKDMVCTSIIQKISEENILKEDGIIVAEHYKTEDLAEQIGKYNKIDERKYNPQVFSFYSIGDE